MINKTKYRILRKKVLGTCLKLMDVEAPEIAAKGLPGQFIILRTDENGERIPLTIADLDREKGLVTIIFQEVGRSTDDLGEMEEGQYLQDFVGPLGRPSEIEAFGTVVCVGGGVGVAPIYPITRAMFEAGNRVISIIGARNANQLILKEEMKQVSHELFVVSDDGSVGEKGLVTAPLQSILDEEKVDRVVAVGPLVMMKAVCEVTRPYGVPTIVSLNPIMVDGTGMCGGCRVVVGGQTRFACVDGPEFDGHQVDWDEARQRARMFLPQEKAAREARGGGCACRK
ncbi:MAG TPA: sulfide/dihydroorotate dehydrogenase-like FAD/NAD-binding protein [Syntrophomonadaceae bacterium]|nr:sulfide/dihydroorotate dehydrogenase-like FAD/NAD-binding protein [Syntrophomonadaceae bacterium]